MAAKRKAFDIETKYNALNDIQKGVKSRQAIASEYGVSVNTLNGCYRTRDAITDPFEKQEFGPKRKKMRKSPYEDLETALDVWLREMRSRDIAIDGPKLQAAAIKFADELKIPDFKGSRGWLDGFKSRKGLSVRRIQGEAKSVNPSTVDAWKTTLLAKLLEEYSADCIYNADETGLFWKKQPNTSLVYKGEDGRGGKRSKERVTLLLAANMTGTDKLKPLVVNRSKNPRAFGRNRSNATNLPVEWEANPSAWMTSEIFSSWLIRLDRRFLRMGKKVALVLDNATCHPKSVQNVLKAIKLIFLPPTPLP